MTTSGRGREGEGGGKRERGGRKMSHLSNLVSLLLVCVQSPREVPGLSVLLFSLSLILLQRPLVHLPSEVATGEEEEERGMECVVKYLLRCSWTS